MNQSIENTTNQIIPNEIIQINKTLINYIDVSTTIIENLNNKLNTVEKSNQSLVRNENARRFAAIITKICEVAVLGVALFTAGIFLNNLFSNMFNFSSNIQKAMEKIDKFGGTKNIALFTTGFYLCGSVLVNYTSYYLYKLLSIFTKKLFNSKGKSLENTNNIETLKNNGVKLKELIQTYNSRITSQQIAPN
ncbi:hypothetical protein [Lyticum sinuosum]|uniref:Uncharacterized protein n=1 Tax=Lyticum sinuosum TaxID=1332059 RepID=A0AAE4VL24_9RICK|nr:hypothetical protein [Lyticum sinuosum]MDZ5761077.1 hypothetical protein [Lyticum sinuosum]